MTPYLPQLSRRQHHPRPISKKESAAGRAELRSARHPSQGIKTAIAAAGIESERATKGYQRAAEIGDRTAMTPYLPQLSRPLLQLHHR